MKRHFFGGAFLFLPLIIHINRSSHCEKKSSFCAFIVHNMFIFDHVKNAKVMKRVILNGTDGSIFNKYAYVQSESEKFYFVALQDKRTLKRIVRAFSKKTLKCFNNTSLICKKMSIQEFR